MVDFTDAIQGGALGAGILAFLAGTARVVDKLAVLLRARAEVRAMDAATTERIGDYWQRRVRELQQEIVRVRGENEDLRSRLARIEQHITPEATDP